MIEIKNITKHFGTKQVVNNLSLSVKQGEKIAIIGPSGCGKSTLLRLIIGLQFPDAGHILIENQDITQMTTKEINKLRLKFGLLFQSSALFDSMNVEHNVGFTLRENFKFSNDEIQKTVCEKLDLVDMKGTEKSMPSDLSGGMKKRIGLARAIAANPEIILYDEPTTGLDPILSTNIEDLIVKLNKKLNITSIIVTHQISTILRTADKIYMMHEGKLLEPETPKTIYHSQNKYIREFIRGGLTE
jgi:phospholipid/cholesterol/gamma-HCH transport system ATP-binding protein